MNKNRIFQFALALAAIIGPLPALAQQPTTWEKMPRMQLERQFAGPLKDTIVQRWRDPADGMVCIIYLPISVQHSTPTPGSFVQYANNTIGSISCMMGPPGARPAAAQTATPATTPAAVQR